MPFCPKCRYEYKQGIMKCPDCDETLVDTLPDKAGNPADDEKEYKDWIQLARLTSLQSAQMVTEALRNKSIPVVVNSGTGHFSMTGQMGMSSFRPIDGGFSVMVPHEFIVDADREAETLLGDEWKKARLVEFD
jgi:hypothetical protein